jgi:hypothetical protein
VRGEHLGFEGDAEALERHGGGLHDRPVGIRTHDDTDEGFAHFFLFTKWVLLPVSGQALALSFGSFDVLASSMVMVIGPTPPGTGVIWPGDFETAGEIDVAAQFAVGQAVDADVDDDGARA